LHSKVDIIFGKVNIKDNDSLITIIHKGSQTLIFYDKKCETTSLVNGALDFLKLKNQGQKLVQSTF
jgi:hypothetical protein